MGRRIKIDINPQLLQWAREESGYKTDEIAEKLDIEPEKYIKWEQTGKDIPIGKLKNIAKQYKRQLAIFFLSDPPPKLKLPKDFRNLSIRDKGLSRDIRLAIRRSIKYQILAEEIQGEDYWKLRYSWIKEIEKITQSNKNILGLEISDWLRQKLKIDIVTQQKFRNNRTAFDAWRKNVERELGIFIFQFDMPVDEVHGFCIAERLPFIIVLNKSHAIAGKIFTIFHELAHIFKHESGICKPDFSIKAAVHEYDCNKFAARFLLPDENVSPVRNLKELENFANAFKISKDVFLRRNFELKYISNKKFYELLEELNKKVSEDLQKKHSEKTKKGYGSPQNKSQSIRGKMFYNLVMEAFHGNRIDHNTASDALALNVKYLING